MGIQWNTNRDKVVERLKVTETFVKRTNKLSDHVSSRGKKTKNDGIEHKRDPRNIDCSSRLSNRRCKTSVLLETYPPSTVRNGDVSLSR